MSSIKKNSSFGIDKFNLYIFYCVLIDIMFLPYFPFFVMPISLPILVLLYMFNIFKINFDYDIKLFYIIMLFVFFSTLISVLFSPNFVGGYNIWLENFKRVFQYLTSFLYFFYVKYIFSKYKEMMPKLNHVINKIFILFVVFIILLAIIYVMDVGIYYDIKRHLNIQDPFMNLWYTTTDQDFSRYSFIWVDPNSIGYMISSVGLFLIINQKIAVEYQIFIMSSMVLVVITSMSSGGLVSLIFAFFAIFVFAINNLKKKSKLKRKHLRSFFVITIILIIVLYAALQFKNLNIFSYSLNRFETNNATSRMDIYANVFSQKSIVNNFILGGGYTLYGSSGLLRPHSDHLRIYFGYGGVAYITSLIFLFGKRKGISLIRWSFVVPAFLCFTINTLIDEQKVFVLFLIMLGIVVSQNKDNNFGKVI